MNQSQIIDAVRRKTGLSRDEVKAVFNGIRNELLDVFNRGGNVSIRYLGRWRWANHQPRTLRSKLLDVPIRMEAHQRLKFVPAKAIATREWKDWRKK